MYWERYITGSVKAVEDIKTAWLINHISHIYGRKKKRRARKQ